MEPSEVERSPCWEFSAKGDDPWEASRGSGLLEILYATIPRATTTKTTKRFRRLFFIFSPYKGKYKCWIIKAFITIRFVNKNTKKIIYTSTTKKSFSYNTIRQRYIEENPRQPSLTQERKDIRGFYLFSNHNAPKLGSRKKLTKPNYISKP
jgi:hypothetical protein